MPLKITLILFLVGYAKIPHQETSILRGSAGSFPPKLPARLRRKKYLAQKPP